MTSIRTALTIRGYTVIKEDLSIEQLEKLRDELTVTPFVPSDYKVELPKAFKLYQESNNKLYIPKSYGLMRYGLPQTMKIHDGQDINIKFTGNIRPEQQEPIQKYITAAKDPLKMGGIITVPCGFGKCLGINTNILMFDGKIKKVQDIKVGDLIMGDDSTSRTILSTCTGQEMLYKVIPEKYPDDSYIVNESHILSLKLSTNQIYDISVTDYLKLNKPNELLGYRVPIEFKTTMIEIDPYIIGYSCISQEITIPNNYKYNSKDIRLKVLAGIIDYHNNYKIIVKNEFIIDDVIYLSRSLGFAANKMNYDNYFATIIHGENLDLIPLKNIKLKQIKDENALVTKIKLEKLSVGNYYGFEIDGNKRFVLGDFTVTHNTTMAIYIMCQLKKKTLIVVHKDFLLQQWKERIQQFAPDSSIGLLKASKIDIEGHDVVIASLQSLSMKTYDLDIFKDFSFLIIDEVHRTSAEHFSEAFKKVNFKYSLGLSATPKRKDGLSKVFMWHMGEIVYNVTKRTDTLEVELREFHDSNPAYSQEVIMYRGKLNVARMINNICEFKPRIDFVVNIIKDLLDIDIDRKILVLSDRRGHVDAMVEAINLVNITAGAYYGGMKDANLKISEAKQVIVATFAYTQEGLDIAGLNTLILTSPKSDLIQVIGRIQRDKPEDRKYVPLVIDIIDNFSLFPKQAKKRLAYYKKSKYTVRDPDDVFRDKTKVKLPEECLIIDD